LADRDPQEAIRLQIGRVDVPEANRYPDGGLIDMNNVPVSALCSATGIDVETAQRIVTTREAIWGFKSLDDLSLQLDLAPQLFDAVSDRLIFLPLLRTAPADNR
jgi:DNA uptake protein ComE-like DNA-binding protein